MDIVRNISSSQYKMVELAFQALNRQFFGGTLPETLLTFHRHHGAYGYYRHEAFQDRGLSDNKIKVSEIALNPDTFANRTDDQIIATLCHEMVHAKQYQDETTSRIGYHNRDFSERMERCGLITSHNGQEGGKRTGQHMTHYIKPGGAFEVFMGKLKNEGIEITWQSTTPELDGGSTTAIKKAASPKNKIKYTCPCGNNVWGKPGLTIECGECNQKYEEVA